MFRTGYTYIATNICRALYDNAQIQLQLQEYCLLLKTHVHAVCSLITKRWIPVSYRYSCIAPTYMYSMHNKLTKIACYKHDIANWFMHARVSYRVRTYRYNYITMLAICWLVDHDAHRKPLAISKISRLTVVSREAKKTQPTWRLLAHATTTVSYLHGWQL